MITLFRFLLWRLYRRRRLERKLFSMSEPQLNLVEARMREAEQWTPGIEELFEKFREHARLKAELEEMGIEA
jgi:hypothetical protein